MSLIKKHFFIPFGITFLAVLSWGLWRLEIATMTAWRELDWLEGDLYSVYLIVVLAAGAYLLPFVGWLHWIRLLAAMLVFSLANLVGFFSGKMLCQAMYCRFCFWERWELLLFLLTAILVCFAFATVYYRFTIKVIAPVPAYTRWLLMLIPLVAFGFAFLPDGDLVAGVKSGVAVLVVVWLLGAMGNWVKKIQKPL